MRSNFRSHSFIIFSLLLVIFVISSMACNLPFLAGNDESTPVSSPAEQMTPAVEEPSEPLYQASQTLRLCW